MHKMITVMMFLALFSSLAAPPAQSPSILAPEPINPYEAIISACTKEESNGDRFAFNPKESAYGSLQIRPIRLIDYSRKTGKHYFRSDLFKPEVTREIFLYYCDQIGPYDLDKIIRDWNGSGEMTFAYLKRVKKHL